MSNLKVTTVTSDTWKGTDNTKFIPCRAIATVSPLSAATTVTYSENISSIVDNGKGDTTFNFTLPMPHANYSVACMHNDAASGEGNPKLHCSGAASAPTLKSTSAVRITTNFDLYTLTLAIFA